jgi:glucose/arabinose dehydrogenase
VKKYLIPILIIVLAIAAVIYWQRDRIVSWFFRPTEISVDEGINEGDVQTEEIKVIAENLNIPWDLEFINNDTFLVTERSGSIKLFQNNDLKKEIPIADVNEIGEGGLLGLTLHPKFNENNFLYLYKTTRSGNQNINVVERYTFKDESLSEKRVIVNNIPGASTHNGGRIDFGPDNFLYITTGDAQDTSLSQNTNSLAGKILRVTEDGSRPNDNPFNNAVYSYGHRNPQGITWDKDGNLWATEHGPSTKDELNLIEKGQNYGWPTITGVESRNGMVTPKINSGTDTWAPSGIMYLENKLLFAGLRGNAIFEISLNDKEATLKKAHFKGDYGRIRFIKTGPDGFIYFGTNNRDGRGQPKDGDDKIIRLDSRLFD